jgi:molecular chaperone DnaK
MPNTINFGIDLGTTNSAIAKYAEGKVEVFKNPLNLKQTLPSVVAFRKNRIVIGDKAQEILQKDPQNVVGSFKRKMGTSDKYFIESIGEFLTAEELSAHVLKELKNFIHTGEQVDAAVITIPASFDTMQSNATKKAGYQAGFQQVVLLQEPIAASLAYANKTEADLNGKKWIVYDLGGGTFDVALVAIDENEMKVVDHEGNNYLGGTDFDKVMVEKYIIPHLEKEGSFANLEKEMKSASGKYNRLYNLLLYKSEEAKIQLTNSPLAEIEFETEDDTGEQLDIFLTISREQLEQAIQPFIQQTMEMIERMMARNGLEKEAIEFILMVGGSTYIPAVRNQLKDHFGIEINCNIDPTTAVTEGAAFYAGTKIRQTEPTTQSKSVQNANADLNIRTAHSKVSKDSETPFIVEAKGNIQNLFYRITRADKGFDSGLQPLRENVVEYLPLVPDVYNEFTFQVLDQFNNVVPTETNTLGITHGKYSIDGQPLPNDICLEVDALEEGTTFLEPIFSKNTVLPLKKTLVKEISHHIRKDSDDALIINVVEGPVETLPLANKTIGFIKISGKELTRDLIKNSDVELTFEMSESRDLRVEVYLTVSGQEFENVFSPSETHVDLEEIYQELETMATNVRTKRNQAESNELYRELSNTQKILADINALQSRISNLEKDDVTDEKYQIDEAKRRVALQVHQLYNETLLQKTLNEYYKEKSMVRILLLNQGDALSQQKFDDIIAQEKSFVVSGNISVIRMKTQQLAGVKNSIYAKDRRPVTDDEVFSYFHSLQYRKYNDQAQADRLLQKGAAAAKKKDIITVTNVINDLHFIGIKKDNDENMFKKEGTGLK